MPPPPPPRRRPPSKFVVPGESNFDSSLLHLPLPLRGSFEHPPARFLRGRGLPTITSARRRRTPSGCLSTATPRHPKLWVSLASPDAFLVHAPAVTPLASLVAPLQSRLTDDVGGGAGHGRRLLARPLRRVLLPFFSSARSRSCNIASMMAIRVWCSAKVNYSC